MLVYFRHERCVMTRVLCMDKVNFNCVVEVFYPVWPSSNTNLRQTCCMETS